MDRNSERLFYFKKLISKYYSTVKCDLFALCFMINGCVLREEKPKQIRVTWEVGNCRLALYYRCVRFYPDWVGWFWNRIANDIFRSARNCHHPVNVQHWHNEWVWARRAYAQVLKERAASLRAPTACGVPSTICDWCNDELLYSKIWILVGSLPLRCHWQYEDVLV